MRTKKLLFILLAVCFMWAFQPETVSAANEGEILVNGTDIVSSQQMDCGTGTAQYDAAEKVLTLNQAVIDDASLSWGIDIGIAGVTVELIGQNEITSKSDICSRSPVTIKGMGGGGENL